MSVVRAIDRGSLVGMGLGIALMLQPWWDGGLIFGFWFVIVVTIVQIVFSHLDPGPEAEAVETTPVESEAP